MAANMVSLFPAHVFRWWSHIITGTFTWILPSGIEFARLIKKEEEICTYNFAWNKVPGKDTQVKLSAAQSNGLNLNEICWFVLHCSWIVSQFHKQHGGSLYYIALATFYDHIMDMRIVVYNGTYNSAKILSNLKRTNQKVWTVQSKYENKFMY